MNTARAIHSGIEPAGIPFTPPWLLDPIVILPMPPGYREPGERTQALDGAILLR